MKEITLTYEKPQIKINGIVFDLQMSDFEIVQYCVSIFEKNKGIEKKQLSPQHMQTTLAELSGMVDKVLGEGATAKLAKGHPVSLKMSMEWLASILKAVCEEFAEHAAQ